MEAIQVIQSGEDSASEMRMSPTCSASAKAWSSTCGAVTSRCSIWNMVSMPSAEAEPLKPSSVSSMYGATSTLCISSRRCTCDGPRPPTPLLRTARTASLPVRTRSPGSIADQPPWETASRSTSASAMCDGTNTTVAPLAKVHS